MSPLAVLCPLSRIFEFAEPRVDLVHLSIRDDTNKPVQFIDVDGIELGEHGGATPGQAGAHFSAVGIP
jgi:hypothetical protein